MPDSAESPASGDRTPELGIGLCLSGGGYRAMLFHLGVLRRLAELGYFGTAPREGKHGLLGSLQRVSSVSGGSIIAGVLGLAWDDLKVDEPGLPERFLQAVDEKVQSFAGQTAISYLSGLWAATVSTMNKHVVKVYRERLYQDATLQDLPDHPRFVINATNLQSGALWRFSKPYARDWKVGEIKQPRDLMAMVVGASSAFPPFLSPAEFEYDESLYTPDTGKGLQHPPFTTRPTLSDGGVYDNLGMETVYKKYRTVIVSDAGGAFAPQEKIPWGWARQSYRVLNTIDNQVRSLRKRELLDMLISRERLGAFWSIRGEISHYKAPGTLPCPLERTRKLADIGTDLAAKDVTTRRRLINWGYAMCDAGIRSYVEDDLPPPRDFPYPEEQV